jgi:hypothetical protein
MSFANYLGRQSTTDQGVFTIPVIDIRQEPTTLVEGARIGDTIVYIGNATYPVNSTSVISSSATFQPAFLTGLNEADYLRVRVDKSTANFTQLMNLSYLVNVNSNSKTKFDIRFALYDTSLALIQAYDPITYDPSNISSQPNLLSQIELQGWSIEIPNQAEYGFLELSGAGITSLGFQYANSQVVNSIDNSDPSGSPLPSRPSKNIFYADWGAPTTDASGILVDLAVLTAEVAQLKIDVSQADLDISDISNRLVALDAEKLDASGGVVQGSLIRGNGIGNYPSGWETPFAKSQSGGAYIVYEGGDVSSSWNPAIGVYGTSTFPVGVGTRKIYMWAGSDSGNQQTPNWETATMEIDDNLTMGGMIQMDGNRITDLANPINPNDATNKTYVDTCGANLQTQINGKLSLTGGAMTGQISMGGNKITNTANPTLATDVATKSYVDTNTAGFLPLAGGSLSGVLNMTGQQITNVGAPVNSGDCANKFYVDNHASGNYLPLSGGTMSGVINMGTQKITNVGAPSVSSDVATVGYADTKLALTGGALTGNVTSNSDITTTGNIFASASLGTAGNVTCNVLNYSALNPPLPATSGLSAVLGANNNANGQNIVNVGNIRTNGFSAITQGTGVQVDPLDYFTPGGGLFIPQEAGASNPGLISFYQYNKATDFVFTSGKTGLVYDLTGTDPDSAYSYVLKRGFTSLFVNRQPNVTGGANNFLTLPDPDVTWVGTKIELLVSGTGNSNNYLTIGVLNDNDGLMLVYPWMNLDLATPPTSTTYPTFVVAFGGEFDWVNGLNSVPTTPAGGIVGLSWWNRTTLYNPLDPADTAKINAILAGIQMYNIECKTAQKSAGFGYRWVITPVYNIAQISDNI